MTRTVVFFRQSVTLVSAPLLILCLFFLAGCSAESDAGPHAAGQFGLEKSEFIALKKAGKSPAELKKEVIKKKIQLMKERGIDVQVRSSKKSPGRSR